ncbi:restriction endonuclease [Streptomyces anulatus]|uniref:restriction endonuclease n=1 Tax=Streptomyces anulatus TaxID=1892 RepID=UPI0036514064
MTTTLPRKKTDQTSHASPESQIGMDWEGRLDDWVNTMMLEHSNPEDKSKRVSVKFQDWSFPTDRICDEFLASARDRNDNEILTILRSFLFENAHFPSDDRILKRVLSEGLELLDKRPEYRTRLLHHMRGTATPQPGVRWALDLLPDWPQTAIDVIGAYLLTHDAMLPDGRAQGLCDAISVIRSRWLTATKDDLSALHEISPRELECMVAALYKSLGYTVILTPASKDGGRDVIAKREAPGISDHVLVECKSYSNPVGVKRVRELLGVVSHEKSNRGVLVTTSRFTRDARILAEQNPRLEIIDGGELISLFCKHLGVHWRERRELLMRGVSEKP